MIHTKFNQVKFQWVKFEKENANTYIGLCWYVLEIRSVGFSMKKFSHSNATVTSSSSIEHKDVDVALEFRLFHHQNHSTTATTTTAAPPKGKTQWKKRKKGRKFTPTTNLFAHTQSNWNGYFCVMSMNVYGKVYEVMWTCMFWQAAIVMNRFRTAVSYHLAKVMFTLHITSETAHYSNRLAHTNTYSWYCLIVDRVYALFVFWMIIITICMWEFHPFTAFTQR